jgi:hypothetical protein
MGEMVLEVCLGAVDQQRVMQWSGKHQSALVSMTCGEE